MIATFKAGLLLGAMLLMLGSAAPAALRATPSLSIARHAAQDTTKKKLTPPDPSGYTIYSADAWTDNVTADEMPVVLSQVQPVYPEEAQRKNISGRLFIGAIVDEHGKIVATKIIRDIGGGCGEAAVTAIRQWTFTPAKTAGKPVKMHVTVPVVFALKDGNPFRALFRLFGGK